MYTTTSMETWVDRLSFYWNQHWGSILCQILGMVLCIFIVCLSIVSKRITGDYKWFVLNQAYANLLRTSCMFLYGFIFYVVIGRDQYFDYWLQMFHGNSPSIWFSFFHSVFYEQLILRIVPYVLPTTLLATIFNRWMAIVCPQRYSVFMRRPLILLYCFSCYLIIYLFTNPLVVRLLSRLPVLENTIVVLVLSAIPWLLAVTLFIHVSLILWKHERIVSNSTDNGRMRENRDVIRASGIQLAFLSIEQGFTLIYYLTTAFHLESINLEQHWSIDPLSIEIYTVYNDYLNFLYPCLIILIFMKPYREAILPPLSPTLKIFTRPIKTEPNTIQVIPINPAPSTPFKGQQPLTAH